MRRRSCHGVESPHRGRRAAQLGFILLAAVGCANYKPRSAGLDDMRISPPPSSRSSTSQVVMHEDVTESETDSSALTRRIVDGYTEINRARNGDTSSSNMQPVWTINDGRRGSPYDASISQYAYWASSTTSTIYNCNYGNWWVSVKFGAPPGAVCPVGGCAYTISEIDLFSLQDNYWTGTDPTTSTTTTYYGNVDFHLLYCPEGTTCDANGSGWVQPPGGYIIANNKAWTKVSFAPVRATAVRASFDCAQSTRAYAVELEAWERLTPPDCPTSTTIPQDNVLPYVGDDNSTASIVADSDRFWWKEFATTNEDAWINQNFAINNPDCPEAPAGHCPAWWKIGRRAQALVQMYDLLAPIDFPRALVYLERLRVLSNALINNRDDKRTAPVPPGVGLINGKPIDPFHNRVMRAWGGINSALNGHWTTEVGLAGLFTYPMAAFAKRVAAHPDWFCLGYRQDAINFTMAVIETYIAFRQDMKLLPSDPGPDDAYGYYKHPWSYSSLHCGDDDDCSQQQMAAGYPLPWNLSLSNVKAMAEVASAADSELYRSSWGAAIAWYATQEAPLLIAKNVNYFLADLKLETLGDGTQWHWWDYKRYSFSEWDPWAPSIGSWPENLGHGQFTLGSLVSIWENKGVIDGLLARDGYPDRVGLNPAIFTRIANTFLRRIWRYDYTPNSTFRNVLADSVKGEGNPSLTIGKNGNLDCAGYAALAQFDPWVWVRCRDSTFNIYLTPYVPGVIWRALREDNHAALLRYRAWWANR